MTPMPNPSEDLPTRPKTRLSLSSQTGQLELVIVRTQERTSANVNRKQ